MKNATKHFDWSTEMIPTHKKDSNFVWTDLSSYDTNASTNFYENVFGWQTHDMGRASAAADDRFGMDEVNYHVATLKGVPVAGIFDMPPFFKQIEMPPFWMSYLAVDHIEGVVARARAIDGVSVDVEPTPFGDGTMSLIRDPLGAGFTVYDGPSINSKGDGSEYGQMVWNELITASIAGVEKFYVDVLGLKLVNDTEFYGKRVKVCNAAGEEIAGIQEVDQSLRTKKVYWIPFFSVDTVTAFADRVVSANGQLIWKTEISSGHNTAFFYDAEGAAFGVAETAAELKSARPWYEAWF